MAKQKPVELMRFYYGERSGLHICGECCNFVSYSAGNRKLFKCKAYGVTCSNRSDWAKKWAACGLFDKPVSGPVISDSAKRIFSRCGIAKDPQEQIEGQTEMEGL